MTQVKRYADAVSLDQGTAVVETRAYDIAGNARVQSTSCCEQTSFAYTTNTQYAWPESQTSGSPSDATKQNTGGATYDYNTGLVLTSTDANGRVSQNEYDANTLRPVYEYSPTGAYQYHISSDQDLWVIDIAYAAGQSGANVSAHSEKHLDGLGRVVKEIAYGKDWAMDVVETKYDNLGRVWQQTRPYRSGVEKPQWSTATYDSLDRPIQTVSPDGSIVTRAYNPPNPAGSSGQPGQTAKVTDPWGRERWARTDALGRMVEVAEPDPNGSGSLSSGAMYTTYNHDGLDRLTQVNQGAQTRKFRYDSLGRLTHQKLAERDATLNDSGQWTDSGQWSDVFFYDTRSNLIRRVEARGVQTHYDFNDPLNRLMAVDYDKSAVPVHLSGAIPDAPDVSYGYVTSGDKNRVETISVTNGMGSEQLSYDSEGRLAQVRQTFTGRIDYPLYTNYIWDSLDRLKESTNPQQYGAGEIRKKVEPAYDMASRIDSLKFGGVTYAANPVYNASSQTTSLNVGGQIAETYGYDSKTGLMTGQQVTQGASLLVDLKYNYTLNNDANNNGAKTGQLTGITDLKNTARNRAYEYDKLGRLSKVKGGVNAFNNPAWHQMYSFDRYGNRTLVAHTDLSMAPVMPGSQSRTDLIGKTGPGSGGGANRIFSADDHFAASGVNKGHGLTTAGFPDSDNAGTRLRGGPRVTGKEHGNAPIANGVGGELRVEHAEGAAPPQGATYSIWPVSTTPTASMEDGGNAIEIGMKFRSDVNGYISGVRFYKGGPENAGAHYGHLWTSAGTLLGTVIFTNETSSGWQEALFPTPIPITANTTYVVSYFAPQGNYLGEDNFFASSGVDNAPLHALQDGIEGGNGVYLYTPTSAFPTNTHASENYWVDVAFIYSLPDTTPPAITSFTPASGATNVSTGANVTVTFSEAMDAATVNGATVELRDPSKALVSATVSYDAGSLTATLDPTAALAPGVTYTARVRGGGTDPRVKDVAGNAPAADAAWNFTTAPPCIGAVPGDHWKGEYFNNQNLSGDPVMVRDDGNGALNFNWVEGSPGSACDVPADNFSARWTRTATFGSGTYRFTVTGDDGVRLYVDGQLKIDAWVLQSPTTYTADVALTAGVHEIKLEYYENLVTAVAALSWEIIESGLIPLDGLANLSYNEDYNRITTSGFEYDPAGNQTRAVINASGTQQQYRYDSANRLVQVLDAGGNVLASYAYGASNQRLMSVEGSVTKYFAWAGGRIVAEYEALGANALVWKTSYVYLGGRLLATTSGINGTETRFHHPDRLGTRLVTDAGGTVVSEQLSMPFGTMLPFTSSYEEDQFEGIAIQSKCEPLSQEETVSIFERFTAEWEEKPALHLAGKFIQAIQTFDKLNFKAIVIETEKEYIAVYWRDSIIWNGGFGFSL